MNTRTCMLYVCNCLSVQTITFAVILLLISYACTFIQSVLLCVNCLHSPFMSATYLGIKISLGFDLSLSMYCVSTIKWCQYNVMISCMGDFPVVFSTVLVATVWSGMFIGCTFFN